jgi:EAL domain-containing protein (putative c-di-GMP-specific phosphodiesterase class I)
MLEKTRLQPAGFALDFGECASLCEEPECQKTIGLLKQVGFHMVAGGLPSQFFGFERLQKLGTDCLRIDAALVRAALADKGAETLVRAIIEIAKENRMAVLADGVDRIDSLLFLTGSGCDAFQGAICSADLGLADLVQRAGSGANSREIGIGRGI